MHGFAYGRNLHLLQLARRGFEIDLSTDNIPPPRNVRPVHYYDRILDIYPAVSNFLEQLPQGAIERDDFSPHIVCGDLAIDVVAREVTLLGRELELTSTEYKLLLQLAKRPDKTVGRDFLLEQVWGEGFDDNVLSVYIRRLRKKIEPDQDDPKYILNEHGKGYKFSTQPPE